MRFVIVLISWFAVIAGASRRGFVGIVMTAAVEGSKP